MLIGVSGKMGAGKDTIGNLILMHTAIGAGWKTTAKEQIELYKQTGCIPMGVPENTFVIKKFASKLKDMVCLLTGCTKEQLEDQEFKKTYAPANWSYILQWTGENMVRENPPPSWPEERVKRYTYREMLQMVGTELFRDQLHVNTWVNALFADYKDEWDGMNTYTNTSKYPNWVITDCRFLNEAKAIKSRGGIMIRVEKTGVEYKDEHPSETGLDKYQFDHVIKNDGTIEDLSLSVEHLLKKLKIIF